MKIKQNKSSSALLKFTRIAFKMLIIFKLQKRYVKLAAMKWN